jgi:hypothetical protein
VTGLHKPLFIALALLTGTLCHAAQPTPCPKTSGRTDDINTNNMYRYYADNGKCGYFHPQSLRIAIPAQWDRFYPFRLYREAEVCLGCEVVVTHGGHDSEMVGGTVMHINRRGQVLKRYAGPAQAWQPVAPHQVLR